MPVLFFDVSFIVCIFPVIITIIHAMINTTPVLIAVPKLDSTPEIPIFPRMEVKLANTADPIAYSNQRFPLTFCSSFLCPFFYHHKSTDRY